jgi:hypothetical protein
VRRLERYWTLDSGNFGLCAVARPKRSGIRSASRRCAPDGTVGQGWDRSERSSALMSAVSRSLLGRIDASDFEPACDGLDGPMGDGIREAERVE